MKVAFADFAQISYDIRSPFHVPLGGSPSAACYLAIGLAARGHEVFLLTRAPGNGTYNGVNCRAWQPDPLEQLVSIGPQILVVLQRASIGLELRGAIGGRTKMILWVPDTPDQSIVAPLADTAARNSFDRFAMVSQWQADRFVEKFAIERSRIGVMRNAASPFFLAITAPGGSRLPPKSFPPVLAYTSTPFRGLNVLLDAFPRIRAANPGTTLKVFSSMQLYGTPPSEEPEHLVQLYRRCRATDGVEYLGSVAQPQLAKAMQAVSVLAYANTFPETSCISVMEAMAAGCRIVTSELGALPETTAGFAKLIPLGPSPEWYVEQFANAVIATLAEDRANPEAAATRLRQQAGFAHVNYNWARRAVEWDEWFSSMMA
jgi:glycosyltransferase involved in cell wall biosynthesis